MEGISKPVETRLQDALDEVEKWKQLSSIHQAAAEAYGQELQHFVYAASHDLQEPLRAITTYTQLLERLYDSDEQARELTTFITGGVARMNDLLQNLLAYSRIGASTARAEVQLSAAVQVSLYKLRPQIEQTAARIDLAELPTVRAHEVQMGQLFENLLRNSLLFRGTEALQIRIWSEAGEEGHTISVADNGIGIEPRFHTQVLQPFKRLHGKDVPGNGLGLAICDKIVKAHGGRLWLESDGHTGTTVSFMLPY